MPGRQSHGRPLLASPSSRKSTKNKSKARGIALDAFAIAAQQVGPTKNKGVRTRDLVADEPEHKRRRGDEEESDDQDGGDNLANARPKRQKRDSSDAGTGDELETDSEGNEWRVGVAGEDDDSDIDSDDAFGESDEDKFEGFTFEGSSSKKLAKGGDGSNTDEDDGDDDSLGEDAIDLAQALDEFSEGDDEMAAESGSEDEESASDGGNTDDDEDESEDDDPERMKTLQAVVSGFADGGRGQNSDVSAPRQNSKIELHDLGLAGVRDANIKRSLKLLKKEEKATKPGASKKLDVPLAKRQNDRLLRIAASEKATETLDRWTDTVKHFRRAEHLVFPLPESLPNAGLDNSELLPLHRKAVGTELESTIMAIMEESGLSASKSKSESKANEGEENPQTISRADLQSVWGDRRREREHQSREQVRAKRIKKIKSKAYRRVRRKANLREELAIEEQEKLEGGGMDSEDEAEAAHRRRAMERMGARHRESQWAKKAKRTGRAAWDDDFREGLTDMARREAELRRRVEGQTKDSDDSDSGSSDSDQEGVKERILRELEEADAIHDDTPHQALMNMPFMKRGEAAQKKLNDETIAQIVRDLDSENEEDDESEDLEEADVGRRRFGYPDSKKTPRIKSQNSEERRGDTLVASKTPGNAQLPATLKMPADLQAPTTASAGADAWARPKTDAQTQATSKTSEDVPAAAGVWSKPISSRERRKAKRKNGTASLDIAEVASHAVAKPKPSSKQAKLSSQLVAIDDSAASDDEEGSSHPLRIHDAELLDRAFGGDDVEAKFEKEKAQIEEEDDDKLVDQGMPGWGTWAGEGVSKRSVKRDQKQQTLVQGVKKKSDRMDAKLERIIISERRVRKNDKYLASKLPFEYETQAQYERSLRLPLGPEWSTKETFQDLTKPRIITKQGIITPISKPMLM